MSNHIQAIVADPFGHLLAQIEPEISDISWLLNDVGGTAIVMRTNDAKWREDYFRPGCMLLLEFDNGLPAWIGISTGSPRIRWLAGKKVSISYQSAEKYLARRRTDKNVTLNQSAGDVVETLLASMNGRAPTTLRAGELWYTSGDVVREYHYDNVFDAIVKLHEDTGGDWGVTGKRSDSGKLDLTLNFWERRGADKPDVALVEGKNATVVDYVEQDADMVNDWVVVGAGNGWGSSSRIEGTAIDDDAIAIYGLWEDAIIENNITREDTLTTLATARLEASLTPRKILTLDTVNQAPGVFATYHLGDRVAVLVHSVGWHGVNQLGRVTGRTFNPTTGVSRVVLELA